MLHNATKEISLCGILCALGVTFLYAGSILPLTPYICLIFAVSIMVVVRMECRKSYSWLCWLATSIIALLLVPEKEIAVLYVFFGYYPLAKPFFDLKYSRIGSYLMKGLFFVVATVASYFLLLFVFISETVLEEYLTTALWMHIATILLGVVLFYSCDILLVRVEHFYKKLRRHHK